MIGQANFGTRDSACTATGLSAPETISVAQGKLVVADSSNARVLIFNQIPTTNGHKANIVLGQGNFTTCVRSTMERSFGFADRRKLQLSGRSMDRRDKAGRDRRGRKPGSDLENSFRKRTFSQPTSCSDSPTSPRTSINNNGSNVSGLAQREEHEHAV